MSGTLTRLVLWLLTAGFLFGATALSSEAAEARITVMVSASGLPYDQTLEGFQKALDRSGKKASYSQFQLGGSAQKAEAAVRSARSNKASLIFAVGTLATQTALRDAGDIPVVAALVLNDGTLKQAPHATGVLLDFPLDMQLQWMRKVLPDVRTIGVIVHAGHSRERAVAASRLAEEMRIRLLIQEVGSPSELNAALARLGNSAEALWGIPDPLVLAPANAKELLLFSHRNRIPLIGPSSSWVKAGALYSLDWDYADMGAQSAELALQILNGARAGSLPPAFPRKVSLSLNRGIIQTMKLSVPDALYREAHTVY